MGQFSAVDLIGRIGDALIERFRHGAVEFFVHPERPTTLRVSIRFDKARDHREDLAQLSSIAETTGAEIARCWVQRNLIAVELPVQPCLTSDGVRRRRRDNQPPCSASAT